MSVRLFHRGARLVVVLRRREEETTAERWLSLHWAPHSWARIFDTALQRLDLAPQDSTAARPGSIAFSLGGLHWTGGRYWTTIDVRLAQAPARKRQLIAAALLRAARYQVGT